MYEDSWYSFVPESKDEQQQKNGHHRRESLLKQSTDGHTDGRAEPLTALHEEQPDDKSPPRATLSRRAKSYSDFYHVVRAQITRDVRKARREERLKSALGIPIKEAIDLDAQYEIQEDRLQRANGEEYQLYRDQLILAERHLDGLLEDTTSALSLLAVLSESFKSVDSQTSAFQSQCEDLLAEQRRLKALGDDVGSGLQYYSYLEPITRRLNAPGASRAIGDDSFVEMLSNLEACIDYMTEHPDHRESETYLNRYRSLLARTLNLLRIKFDDILTEDTAHAAKRIPDTKMNMTSVFVIQAPQTNPVANELEGFMKKLQDLAYGPDIQSFANGHRPSRSNYESEYVDVYRQLVEAYVARRRTIVTPILDKLLVREESEEDNADKVAKWTRDCFQAVLEVAANESDKYALLFVGQRDRPPLPYGSFDPFFANKNHFQDYLSEIIRTSLSMVRPRLVKHLDMQTSIDLVTWLRQYDYQTMAEENGTASSHEDDLHENLDNDAMVKARLALQFKEALAELVFDRMNAILLRDIEKYIPKPDELDPRSATGIAKSISSDTDSLNGVAADGFDGLNIVDDPSARAETVLGQGVLNAYAPVKTSVRLLTIYNDLTRDSRPEEVKSDIAYNIMHQTCQAIMRAAAQVTAKHTQIDGRIFAIKNLVLLKNIILTYEISGSKRNAAIDFSPMWNSFADLRSRGGLFDVRAYYDLLTTQHLLPRVVENLEDARAELDGLMRATITQFREECADMLFNKKARGPVKDEWKVKAGLQSKLEVMFSHEKQLRDNLWAAVEETITERRQDLGNGTRIV